MRRCAPIPRAEPRNLRAWVLTIARRKAIDHHRSRAGRAMPVAEPQELIDRQADRGQASVGGPSAWA